MSPSTGPAGPPAIRTQGLKKHFGKIEALKGVDISVPPATVLGLLGPNGAGKTTTIRILTTLLQPDAGTAEVAGYDVVKDAAKVRTTFGLAGQYAAVDENLTGRENLELVGRLYHIGRDEARRRAVDILERFNLTEAANRPVKTYSGGMRRRLDLGASLVGQPRILFLDEPTTGLDPQGRIEMWELIEQLVDEGLTVLLTTQYLDEADRLCDRIAVIDGGLVIAEGTANELKSRIGGEVIELRVASPRRTNEAARKLAGLGDGEIKVDAGKGEISIPVRDEGGALVVEVVRRLDAARIKVAEIALRRPTLDDVFLTLTGHRAVENGDEAPEPKAARRASRRIG